MQCPACVQTNRMDESRRGEQLDTCMAEIVHFGWQHMDCSFGDSTVVLCVCVSTSPEKSQNCANKWVSLKLAYPVFFHQNPTITHFTNHYVPFFHMEIYGNISPSQPWKRDIKHHQSSKRGNREKTMGAQTSPLPEKAWISRDTGGTSVGKP